MNKESMSSILLIEDNTDDYESTLRSLQKNHFLNPVKWCDNGKDALDYLNKTGEYSDSTDLIPGLVLLDLNMPGTDGRQVLMQIKESEKLRHIPVVILSTSADSKDVDKCYELGASTYIQKPINFEGLTKAIQAIKDYWFEVAILHSNNR